MPQPWHQRQKKLGVKLVLFWFAPRNCWKKYHEGEVKYFKQPNSAAGCLPVDFPLPRLNSRETWSCLAVGSLEQGGK